MAQFGTHESTSLSAPPEVVSEPARAEGPGPGVQAIEALVAQGRPGARDVIKVRDAHRGEHDAILAVLHRELGNGYVTEVMDAMARLRLDVDRKELAAGDPGNAEGGYFIASGADKGARWRTADGSFTGQADGNGLRSRYALDGDTALLGGVEASSRTATLGVQDHDRLLGEGYGRYGGSGDWAAGLRGSYDVGGGATLSPELRHVVAAGAARDELVAGYRSEATTADGYLRHDGAGLAAGVSGTHRFDEHASATGSLAHGPDGTTGSLGGTYVGGEGRSVTGAVAHGPDGTTESLTAAYRVDDRNSVGGSASHGPDGTIESLTGTHRFDDHASMTGTVNHGPAGTTESASGTYGFGEGRSVTGTVNHGADGTTESLTGAYRVDDHTSLTGTVDHGPAGTSGSLGATYADERTSATGTLTDSPDATALALSGSHKVDDFLSLTGSVDHTRSHVDGSDQTTLALGERYRSPTLIHGVDVTAGAGTRDYQGVTASADVALGPQLFAGAFGGFTHEAGHQTTGTLGGSLTFTPSEKTALTLAGLVDQQGRLETRLQLDMFKSRIDGLSDFSDHKKDALVSLFVSHTTDGGPRGLDDRFGSPQYETSGGGQQVTAGVNIRF